MSIAIHGRYLRKLHLRFEGLQKQLAADSAAGNAEIASEPAYMEMQVAIEGKAGSQMGDSIIAAQPPDYKKALEICTDLLAQSKHLALFVSLTKAASGVHGFQGLADAMALTQSIAGEQWDTIHPEEDKDDPDDPWWERINLLRELTDNPQTGDHLYTLNLVNVRHIGAFSKRDIDIAAGRREGSEEDKERCNPNLIRGAFTESKEEELIATDSAMADVLQACDDLNALFGQHIGADAPSFDNLKKQVEECRAVFREYAAEKLDVADVEDDVDTQSADDAGTDTYADTVSDSEAATPASSTQTTQVVVNSTAFADRDAVAAAFDSVMLFYQKYEPSSPVPILVFRARQMVYKNFFDILRELAPQHSDNFRQLMTTLRDDPLSFLLEHSYNSFLKGESFSIETDTAVAAEVAMEGGDGGHAVTDVSGSAEIEGITSRNQVVQTLKDIQKFFEVHEPSSPVPLIVQRVRNLVPKTFLDLLAEFEVAVEEPVDPKAAKKAAK